MIFFFVCWFIENLLVYRKPIDLCNATDSILFHKAEFVYFLLHTKKTLLQDFEEGSNMVRFRSSVSQV